MSQWRIRRIAPADVPDVVELVHDLAEYERARHECRLTTEQLSHALFAERPALYGHVAEVDDRIAGFALWFLNFSTWTGKHGIYLEDLFIRPEHRGRGLGTRILRALARECVTRGYTRLEWSVLDWNTPATDFYQSLGAVAMDSWTVFRLNGEALDKLGA